MGRAMVFRKSASEAYEDHCKETGQAPNKAERKQFMESYNGAAREDWEEALEHYYNDLRTEQRGEESGMKDNTARIFREMQASDQIRDSIKQGILDRTKEKLGTLYEKGQDVARESGLQGAINDCYRRLFENAWFQKDIFDGRYHWDTKGHDNEAQQKLGGQYDTRQQFYGWDRQNEGQEQQRGQERDRGEDMER